MKPLVYIAGPYTNPDPVLNTRKAIQFGMALYETGLCAVEIPHLSLLSHMVEPRDIDYWYQFDLDKLEHCQFLFRLPGASSGADKEVEVALACGISVVRDCDVLIRALAGGVSCPTCKGWGHHGGEQCDTCEGIRTR